MELIIKPTEKCNFSCTFCSSTNISDEHAKLLDLESIFQFLDRFPQTNSIIINGGDPLVVAPIYYQKIINYIRLKGLSTKLSFTSNLWAFYKNPEKWIPIFTQPEVGVSTSFNYGGTRRITKTQEFTESHFRKISDMMLEHVGYRPDFIAVLTDENLNTAIDTVLLAKDLNVECKLNYAMASGIQSKPLMLGKIYEKYVEIYEKGLYPWEFNTKQLMVRLSGVNTTCPQSNHCSKHIRCLQPSGDYYSCGALGDDRSHISRIDFKKEMDGPLIDPFEKLPIKYHYLKESCLSCDLFKICNGCVKTIGDLKNHGMVESHCSKMKELEPRILKIGDGNVSI